MALEPLLRGPDVVTIDVTQLDALAKDLRKASVSVAKDFDKGLVAAGKIVAADAKSRAGFSSRIPGSIRVRRRGRSVRVQAGGSAAPHAPAFENQGNPGTFRHPVYGNFDVWVAQQAHPFLGPAAEAKEGEMLAAILAVVDVSMRRVGL